MSWVKGDIEGIPYLTGSNGHGGYFLQGSTAMWNHACMLAGEDGYLIRKEDNEK